jgi:hypothetical protein
MYFFKKPVNQKTYYRYFLSFVVIIIKGCGTNRNDCRIGRKDYTHKQESLQDELDRLQDELDRLQDEQDSP